MSTDSDPWRYCIVCKRHHDQGRSHIFTTKHKAKLDLIISKFSKKVHSACRLLQKPSVMEGELEPGIRLWCYCCSEEVPRHVTDGLTTVVWGGLLEHMASPEHHRKTRHFWWVNGADSKLLQKFILFEAEYRRYKELVTEALKQLERAREEKVQKAAEQLKVKEKAQFDAAMEPPASQATPTPVYKTVKNKQGVMQNPTGWHDGYRVWGGGIVKYKTGSDQLLCWPIDSLHTRPPPSLAGRSDAGGRSGKVTVAASGGQLTAIQLPSLGKEKGNVHSGATPPWLKDDDDDLEGGVPALIGPSEEEFLIHKKHTRKSDKNPRRVGADFHRKHTQEGAENEEWLPSFGRVWNSGPRSHSLAEFRRERSSHPPAVSSPYSHSQSTQQEVPGTSGLSLGESATALAGVKQSELRPYVRKRKRKTGADQT